MTTTTTRRAMLAGAAALPALASSPAHPDIWAPRPDPIFAAIERHRAAMAECHDAVAVSSALRDDAPEHAAAQAITDRASAALDAAGEDLGAIEPTTTAGLLAVLGYVIGSIEAADDDELDGPGDRFDGGNWRLPHQVVVGDDGTEQHFALFFLRSIQRTVARLSVRGA